jgi:hypothetical protein
VQPSEPQFASVGISVIVMGAQHFEAGAQVPPQLM